MDNRYKPAQAIRKDEQAALKVETDRHKAQLNQVASLEEAVVSLAEEFVKRAESDTAGIVGAIDGLSTKVDHKYLELKPIAEGLHDLLKATAESKRTPAVELHFDKGINPAGSYKEGKSYRAGDAVTFGRAVYVAKQDTRETPSHDTWLLLLPEGQQGAQGLQGLKGEKGDKGDRGLDGRDGKDGLPGERGQIGPQGPQGERGPKGDTGEKGDQGEKGEQGERGPQGQGWRGIPGVGVPEGGTTGQILAKASNADHDTEWVAAGSGSGDMLASVYDPTNVAGDAFDQDNMVDGTTNKNFTATEKTKLAGIEAAADVTDAANVDAAGAVMNSDTSTASMSFVIDEDSMATDSATKVPTQQSVKAYVDAEIAGIPGGTVSEEFVIAMGVAL